MFDIPVQRKFLLPVLSYILKEMHRLHTETTRSSDYLLKTVLPEDRNGRHWMRVELGMILMKFAFEISVQLWSPL